MKTFEKWIGGVISASSGGALSALTAVGFDPSAFNFVDPTAIKKTIAVATVGAAIGVMNYLKQSPLPVDLSDQGNK